MAITTKALEDAAFWDRMICADCGHVFGPDDEEPQPGPCPECDSAQTLRALHVVALLTNLEDPEEV